VWEASPCGDFPPTEPRLTGAVFLPKVGSRLHAATMPLVRRAALRTPRGNAARGAVRRTRSRRCRPGGRAAYEKQAMPPGGPCRVREAGDQRPRLILATFTQWLWTDGKRSGSVSKNRLAPVEYRDWKRGRLASRHGQGCVNRGA